MKPQIIIIRENLLESIVADLFSLATALTFSGIGVWLDSAAMQWSGAIIFFIVLATMAVARAKEDVMTIERARQRLDEIEEELHRS